MTRPTFTVPATATYQSTDGTRSIFWRAGTVISRAQAVEFGLTTPLPEPPDTSATGLLAKIDALEAPGSVTRERLAPEVAAAVIPRGGRTIPIGDSITQGGMVAGVSLSGGLSYATYAMLASDGVIQLLRNAGVPGNTTAQMLARLESDVLAHIPDRVPVMGGTNDVDMPGYARAATLGNLTTMWDAISARGGLPIPCTIPPRAITGWMAETVSLNAGIRAEAAKRNLPLVDFWSLLVDPATGMYKAGASLDSLHPTAATGKVMGDYFWEAAESLYTTAPPPDLVRSAGAGVNLITNGLFTDSNADGLADGWSGSQSDPNVVYSIEDDPTIPGNWQVLRRVADGSNAVISQTVARAWNDGDVLEFAGRVAGTNMGAGTAVSTQMVFAGQGGAAIEPVSSMQAEATGIFRMQVVPPNGSASVSIRARVGTVGTATIKVAQMTLLNLTALGLA